MSKVSQLQICCRSHNKMSGLVLIIALSFNLSLVLCYFDNEIKLECIGTKYRNVTLTAFYPDYNNEDHELDYVDKNGHLLKTLQDYLDNRAQFVTLSMDPSLNITYGTRACIPELNKHFGHRVILEVRDSSSDLKGSGYKRAEICVRTEIDSYDVMVNRKVTLIFPN